MKIKWLDGARYVPRLGTMVTGKIYDVDEAIAEQLIKQGQAEPAVKPKPKKTKI